MLIADVENYGASRKIIDILLSTGIKELYPPQEQAIQEGLLRESKSFVVASPTASGKTLIAEMASLKTIIEKYEKVIYLVPLRALAREKYDDFRKKYSSAGIKVVHSTGDYDSTDPFLGKADIIISTNEKMDSLIRHNVPWLNEVGLIVADEIHLLGDVTRGPTLEIVLTKLRSISPHVRIIALSATIPNGDEIAGWLDAHIVASNWRPVPLREGVFFNDAIIFNDGSVTWIERESSIEVMDMAVDTIRGSGQVLVFVNSRRSTETLARNGARYIRACLSEEDKAYLDKLSRKILSVTSEPTRICRKLSAVVRDGVAFHHAGVLPVHRRIIEDAFRANRMKMIVATTTLAMGLNLPSRRVIIRDWLRYESRRGMEPISTMEIKQMSGRAGRPGYDSYGEAVLVAKNRGDEKRLFDAYIKGRMEKVVSHLGEESALRSHILAIIAGEHVSRRDGLIDFLKGAFFTYQKGIEYLIPLVDDILEFLYDEGMIVDVRSGFRATLFGKRISDLYIDPLTGVILRDCLKRYSNGDVFSLCHMICHTPDMMVLKLRQKDIDEMISLFYDWQDKLLISESERFPTTEILAELKSAFLLVSWIDEESEDKIAEDFGVGPGDIRTMVELADWLLYSAGELCKIFIMKEVAKIISKLRVRISYGVKEELLELVTLKNIGRIRARSLYDGGYRTRKDIKKATIEELSAIKNIGTTVAMDIKSQVL